VINNLNNACSKNHKAEHMNVVLHCADGKLVLLSTQQFDLLSEDCADLTGSHFVSVGVQLSFDIHDEQGSALTAEGDSANVDILPQQEVVVFTKGVVSATYAINDAAYWPGGASAAAGNELATMAAKHVKCTNWIKDWQGVWRRMANNVHLQAALTVITPDHASSLLADEAAILGLIESAAGMQLDGHCYQIMARIRSLLAAPTYRFQEKIVAIVDMEWLYSIPRELASTNEDLVRLIDAEHEALTLIKTNKSISAVSAIMNRKLTLEIGS
jgi:hypothetical protein